jgi:hypothetical protein
VKPLGAGPEGATTGFLEPVFLGVFGFVPCGAAGLVAAPPALLLIAISYLLITIERKLYCFTAVTQHTS